MQSWRLLVPILLATTLACAPTEAQLSGGEWTRFRGEHSAGAGEAPAIPTQWTHDDYTWRVPLPGLGHSSPVVWGTRIYVTSAVQEDATRHVLCLDTADGRTVWQRSFPTATFDLGNATAYDASSPAVDEDRVYIVWANPNECILLALDRHNGETLWRRDLGPIDSEHGFGTSPIVFEDLVIQLGDNKAESWIAALDRATGEVRWRAGRDAVKTAFCTPLVYQPEGGRPQLITTGWGPGFTAYDPHSGRRLWQLPVFDFRCVASPLAAGGLIFGSSGTGGGGRQMFAVRPGVPEKGIDAEVVYELTGSLPYVPTPVAHGDLLFLWNDAGVVQCVDIPTGNVHWRERVGGRYFGSPVRVEDRLYGISREGKVVVLAATREYRLLAEIDLEEPSHSTPVVAGGVMYLRTFSHLMALGGPPQRRHPHEPF